MSGVEKLLPVQAAKKGHVTRGSSVLTRSPSTLHSTVLGGLTSLLPLSGARSVPDGGQFMYLLRHPLLHPHRCTFRSQIHVPPQPSTPHPISNDTQNTTRKAWGIREQARRFKTQQLKVWSLGVIRFYKFTGRNSTPKHSESQ